MQNPPSPLMLNAENWGSRVQKIGKLEIFERPQPKIRPQPSMDRKGPPNYHRSGIGLFDRDEDGDRDEGSSYFPKRAGLPDLWDKTFFWARGLERFVINIRQNQIFF